MRNDRKGFGLACRPARLAARRCRSGLVLLTGGSRARRRAHTLLLIAVVIVAMVGSAAADARPARFAFQPITIQRINLPTSISEVRWPGFAGDSQHVLFFSSDELWITDLTGASVHCLTCGVANDPAGPNSADLATPFPDGKRILIDEDIGQPGKSNMAVLACQPSVDDCQTKQILSVDYSSAEPAVIPPGGALIAPQQTLVGAAYHAKLSPDGRYIAFSVIRTDAIEAMVVGRLTQNGNQYVVSDPKVINPPAPTSPTDPNPDNWSLSGGLMEFKSFTHGGADATYVETGGSAGFMSVQDWSVNLATGRRTQLTDFPDWNEDNGTSPNGKLLSLYSERTMHYIDWIGGLVSVPDFIDAPASAMVAGTIGGLGGCEGPMWLLPASGDNGGALAGEPIVDARHPGLRIVDNLSGASQWSPDGTRIALSTSTNGTAQVAPRVLLVAHLTSVKTSHPVPAVSSQPGSWATTPSAYHGPIGYVGTITLHGPAGGTVTVSYNPLAGAFAGNWSETYAHYSQNGRDFVNGTMTVGGTALDGTLSEHLTMTGADTGSDNTDLTFASNGASGHASSTYDGHTITGPPAYAGRTAQGGPAAPCPYIQTPKLHFRTSRVRHGVYRITVTATIAGAGPAEALRDTQLVDRATLKYGRRTTYTNSRGVATVYLLRSQWLHVSAGDTLRPSSVRLIVRPKHRR